ncbi:MAG: HD domain-containing protein [Actinobacteria bacterium]|uniref:Unannotated protein n=1 Tax=freshwater metagenome TaxID=449393 RepID=A0A6J7QDX4_9ZZZZ|nr:HD domain-containing protein [Actinomycetota bacterium]MSW42774.1 HD domain-containing protein [Actinomycetota bacterium]
MTEPSTNLTGLYSEAVAYAAALHAAQLRKETQIPYMSHLLGVSSLVIEAGVTQEQAIAGLLHDAVEDAGGMPRYHDIKARFGDDVARIVLGCSDSTDEKLKASIPYWDRKTVYLKRLAAEPDDVVLVSMADKVHNARAIVTDLEKNGVGVLEKFKSSTDEMLTYYAACLHIGTAKKVSSALLIPLSLAVTRMRELVDGAAPLDAMVTDWNRALSEADLEEIEAALA